VVSEEKIESDVLVRIYHGLSVRDAGVPISEIVCPNDVLRKFEMERLAFHKRDGSVESLRLTDDGLKLGAEIAQKIALAGKNELAELIKAKRPGL